MIRLVAMGTDGILRTYEVVQIEAGYEDYLVCYCNMIVKDEYDRYYTEIKKMYLYVGYRNAESVMKEAVETGYLIRHRDKIYLDSELPDLLPIPINTEKPSSAAASLGNFNSFK